MGKTRNRKKKRNEKRQKENKPHERRWKAASPLDGTGQFGSGKLNPVDKTTQVNCFPVANVWFIDKTTLDGSDQQISEKESTGSPSGILGRGRVK